MLKFRRRNLIKLNYKIVFFDIDGTLIDYKLGKISEATKMAIQRLKQKSILVIGATGRPLSMCKELESWGIDGFITANGAYVKFKDEVIYKSILDQETVYNIHQFAKQNRDSLSYFTEKLNMNDVHNEITLRSLQQTLSLNAYPEIDEDILNKEIYLMCLYGSSETIQIYQKTFPNLLFQQWHPYIANVLQTEVSKSIAAKYVLNYFGYLPSEAIAFGDGENDIDLLKFVGLGIAMGNGNQKLKAIADFVTKDCDNEGVEYALKTLQII